MTVHDQLQDWGVEGWLADAEDGDTEAVRVLHSVLADCLRNDRLTPYTRELLADMHESIARGHPADVAMLTKPLTGRAPEHARDGRVHGYIEDELIRWKLGNRFRAELKRDRGTDVPNEPPKLADLYKLAAAEFDLSVSSVKRIYLAQRRALKQD